MVVFGGYLGGNICDYSNNIYMLNLDKLSWESLSLKRNEKKPCQRASAGMCIFNDFMYVFGGGDLSQKFNDLWQFSFKELCW